MIFLIYTLGYNPSEVLQRLIFLNSINVLPIRSQQFIKLPFPSLACLIFPEIRSMY